MTAADGVGLEDQRDRVRELDAVDGDRATLLEADRDVLGGDLDVRSQNGTPMIGSTISMQASRCSSALASCVAPQMFASVEYAFAVLSRYGRPRASSHSDISLRPPSSPTKLASSHGL